MTNPIGPKISDSLDEYLNSSQGLQVIDQAIEKLSDERLKTQPKMTKENNFTVQVSSTVDTTAQRTTRVTRRSLKREISSIEEPVAASSHTDSKKKMERSAKKARTVSKKQLREESSSSSNVKYNPAKDRFVYKKDEETSVFSLSRNKVKKYQECNKCFALEFTRGVASSDFSFPLTLNMAVDSKFKAAFDLHRAEGTAHPIFVENGYPDLVPFAHPKINEWFNTFKGLRSRWEGSNIDLCGAPDEILVDHKTKTFYLADYKATSTKKEVTLDDAWKIDYKRQIEFYQMLLRRVIAEDPSMKNYKDVGYTVSNTGFIIYANAESEKPFDGKLEFQISFLKHEGDPSWIEPTIRDIQHVLLTDGHYHEDGSEVSHSEKCSKSKYRHDYQEWAGSLGTQPTNSLEQYSQSQGI